MNSDEKWRGGLRERAEDKLRAEVEIPGELSIEAARRIIYELKVHQMELEIQNEELRKAHDQLEQQVMERTSELREANDRLTVEIRERENAQQKLKKSHQELQEFSFVASHDLQEPLRKIRGFGELLEKGVRDIVGAGSMDHLNRMMKAAQRMQDLLQALLAYSRVGTRGEPFKAVDLRELITGVAANLEHTIKGTGGRIEVEDLPVIEADLLQMRQLFQNLIANGLKFRHETREPVVKVFARESTLWGEGNCIICVQDNGIGFEMKYLERIFAPFQRLHGRSAYEGAGMGLSICRKIVERHNGSITAESSPGNGTTFIVTLPLKQPKEGEDGSDS